MPNGLAESRLKSLGVSKGERVASPATVREPWPTVPNEFQTQPMKARWVRLDDRSEPDDDAGGDPAARASSRPYFVIDCLRLSRVSTRIYPPDRRRALPRRRDHSKPLR